MTLIRRYASVPAPPATPYESIDTPRSTEAVQQTSPGAEASKPSIPPEIHQEFVKAEARPPSNPEMGPQPPGESAALLPSLSSLEDPGAATRTGVGHAAPFPSHHHRFYTLLVNGKLRSMPCECGLTWEENVEMAVTRYDRAARREGGR